VIFSNGVCNTFTAMSSQTLLSDHVGLNVMVILKLISEKEGMKLCTELNWLSVL
jgi:hypothetical protein